MGIFRTVSLLLDKLSASKMERDAQEALRKGTDPRKAEQNLSAIDSALDRLRAGALKLGAAIAATFALSKIKNFAEDSIRAAADAEKIWSSLGSTVESAGVSFKKVRPELEKAAAAFQDATTMDDEDFATILQRLIALTGNYSVSLRNVGLVANVAARYFDGDLAPAAELVGKTLTGQTKGLKALGIVTNDAGKGIEMLAKGSMTAMTDRAETLAGKTQQLTGRWNNFKEALGDSLIAGAQGTSTLDQLTTSVIGLTGWITGHKSDIAALAELILNIGKAAAWTAGVIAQSVKGYDLFFTWLRDKVSPARPTTQDFHNAGLTPDRLAASLSTSATPAGGLDINRPGGAVESPQAAAARDAAAKRAAADRATLITRQFERAQARKDAEADILASTRKHLTGFRNEQANAAGVLGSISPSREEIDGIRNSLHLIEESAQGAAAGISGAFQDSFSILLDGFSNVGEAAKALGTGIAGALLGGLAQFASGKVRENIAAAFEAAAYALGFASHGNFVSAAAAWKSAAGHTAAAVAWGAVAGAGGAGQHAVAGGGRGGTSGGIPSGATDIGGRISENVKSGTLIINLDGVDPDNPRHQRLVYDTNQQAVERFGSVYVNGRRVS